MDASADPAPPAELTIGGDLVVRRVGFGAMRITGDGIWGPPADRDAAIAVLRSTQRLGVNFIDTADSYGPGFSEELIREALHPFPDDLVIATKGGFTRSGPDRWQADGRPEHLRAACEASLERLGVDSIDLYQFHTPDPEVPIAESLGELAALQEEGKIRHLGVCNFDLGQLRQARDAAAIVSVQNRYSVRARDSDPVVDECERSGLAFLPWAPLLSGTLTRRRGTRRKPWGNAEGAELLSTLREVGESLGATPFQVAIAWLLHRSPAMLPIPGTASSAHLAENVAAAELRFSREQLEALRA
jgi:pyridoxine 4-dehydrogenase